MGFCLVSEQTLPLYLGEISSSCMGVAFECLDDEGIYITSPLKETFDIEYFTCFLDKNIFKYLILFFFCLRNMHFYFRLS